LTQQTRGIIINYRIGPQAQKPKECIIQFKHVQSLSEAARLVGRKVVWQNEKSRIIGQIKALHGKKGVVRARFRKGLPGQALGATVELIG
jgi:large subunit ribosomal protein L35Ae